ncbi:hypothetical protein QOT17_002770 [Balamuthia mandrillaris]
MDAKPNLRPTRTKYKHGATVREEFAVEGSSDKETLQVVHFLYDESTGSHHKGGRTDFDYPFGFLPGRNYSLDNKVDGRRSLKSNRKQRASVVLLLRKERRGPHQRKRW